MSAASNSAGALRALVERIERLEADKAEVAEAIREVFAEAKGEGFDVKALRSVVRERRLTPAERAERDALRDTYMAALGMLAETPLGEAAGKALAREAEAAVRGSRGEMIDRVRAAFGAENVTVSVSP